MAEFDYRKILKAYIAHVVHCEGTTFISGGWWCVERLSEQENRELAAIEKELIDG